MSSSGRPPRVFWKLCLLLLTTLRKTLSVTLTPKGGDTKFGLRVFTQDSRRSFVSILINSCRLFRSIWKTRVRRPRSRRVRPYSSTSSSPTPVPTSRGDGRHWKRGLPRRGGEIGETESQEPWEFPRVLGVYPVSFSSVTLRPCPSFPSAPRPPPVGQPPPRLL